MTPLAGTASTPSTGWPTPFFAISSISCPVRQHVRRRGDNSALSAHVFEVDVAPVIDKASIETTVGGVVDPAKLQTNLVDEIEDRKGLQDRGKFPRVQRRGGHGT